MARVNLIVVLSVVSAALMITACGVKPAKDGKTFLSEESAGKPKKLSIVQKMKEKDSYPVAERIALYYQLKKESPTTYDFLAEEELTMYGYGCLWENKVEEALAIFKLIVAEFPNSANAYDSLGEAFLKNGNKDLAIQNYERSLTLDPDNFNAEDQLMRIKFPNRPPPTPEEKFNAKYSAQEYREDLDQLGKMLLMIHPNALKFITKEAFSNTIAEKKALISEKTTFAEFAWHCSEIIANTHCSHTNMGSFYFEGSMLPLSLRFPIHTRWIDQKLYVVDPYNNGHAVKVKDEIISINGLSVATLMQEMYKHIPAQGYIKTTKSHFFNTWSTAIIPYALGFPLEYEIVVRGKNQPIILQKADKIREPFRDPTIKKCENGLCLEFLDNQKTAILTIATFNYYRWNNYKVFEAFIDSSFQEIAKNGTKHLIIDVRQNGGGSQSASIHLLRYLLDKPFTYYSNAQFEGKTEKIEGEDPVVPFEKRYKGKVYFMIDGLGNSTTGHFMSIVKYLKLGTIVGEELGSNQFCSAGQKICRLKHTKLEYYVANNTHESLAISLPDETGILPDHLVTQSLDEYLNRTDAVKAYTLNLIKK